MKRVFSVYFTKTRDSKKEEGIAIGDDTGSVDIIIDKKGRPVVKLYDYQFRHKLLIEWHFDKE